MKLFAMLASLLVLIGLSQIVTTAEALDNPSDEQEARRVIANFIEKGATLVSSSGPWKASDKIDDLGVIRCSSPTVLDVDLLGIESLTGLNTFDGSGTSIGDAGIARLARCSKLSSVGLSFCPNVTKKGLGEIGRMTKLTHLRLSGTPAATDAGIAELRDLKSLKRLELRETQITDAAVTTFEKLPNLEYLDVVFSEFTMVAADRLRKSHPKLEIYPLRTSAGREFSYTQIRHQFLHQNVQHVEQLHRQLMDLKEGKAGHSTFRALRMPNRPGYIRIV